MGEEEFRPRSLGLKEFDEDALFHFENLEKSLEWKDGQRPEPFEVHQALARMASALQPQFYPGEVVPPDQEKFLENMDKVRDAFGLVAFTYMSESGKLQISTHYGWRKGELTITPRQKGMLTMITTAAGIPDKPDQLTYKYSMVARPSAPGNGQGKASIQR